MTQLWNLINMLCEINIYKEITWWKHVVLLLVHPWKRGFWRLNLKAHSELTFDFWTHLNENPSEHQKINNNYFLIIFNLYNSNWLIRHIFHKEQHLWSIGTHENGILMCIGLKRTTLLEEVQKEQSHLPSLIWF